MVYINHINSSMISTKTSATQLIFKYITNAHMHMKAWVYKYVGIYRETHTERKKITHGVMGMTLK